MRRSANTGIKLCIVLVTETAKHITCIVVIQAFQFICAVRLPNNGLLYPGASFSIKPIWLPQRIKNIPVFINLECCNKKSEKESAASTKICSFFRVRKLHDKI